MKKLIPVLIIAILFLSCKEDDNYENLTAYDKDNEIIGEWIGSSIKTLWINQVTNDTFNLHKDTTFTVHEDTIFKVFPSELPNPHSVIINKNHEYIFKPNGNFSKTVPPGKWSINDNMLILKFGNPDLGFWYHFIIRNSNQFEFFNYSGTINTKSGDWVKNEVYIYKRKQ